MMDHCNDSYADLDESKEGNAPSLGSARKDLEEVGDGERGC